MTERAFRLGLTIQDDADIDGAHAAIALAAEEGKDTPILYIQAGGFPATDAGARMLAGMLEDAAEAIYEKVGRPEVHTDTAALHAIHVHTGPVPTVERKRTPRFNPQPRGKQG